MQHKKAMGQHPGHREEKPNSKDDIPPLRTLKKKKTKSACPGVKTTKVPRTTNIRKREQFFLMFSGMIVNLTLEIHFLHGSFFTWRTCLLHHFLYSPGHTGRGKRVASTLKPPTSESSLSYLLLLRCPSPIPGFRAPSSKKALSPGTSSYPALVCLDLQVDSWSSRVATDHVI